MFINKLFIGIGATSCYFTLRETYEHTWFDSYGYSHVEVRSSHHFNLSQNADEAFTKAQTFAEENAIPLITTRDSLTVELNEIIRATEEERATRTKSQADKEALWAVALEEKYNSQLSIIAEGRYPFGQHTGKNFNEAPISYINWLVNAEFEITSVSAKLAEAVRISCADLILPIPDKTKTTGVIGKRQDFEAIVVRKAGYSRPAFNRYHDEWVNIITLVTNDGVCLVTKGTSFDADVGQRISFKATVKQYDEFRGQAQTLIQRVAVK